MKRIIAVAILVFAITSSLAQNKQDKWVVGLSGSFISFGDDGKNGRIAERFNFQVPKINVARYLFSGLTAEAGVTISTFKELDGFFKNEFNYFSLDGSLRYDFNLSEENLVPYFAIGGSIIAPPSTIEGSNTTATLNFSFGATYWITHRWGLNAQGTFKYSPEKFRSMRSHAQLSAGLVYSLTPRVLVYRLWDGRRAR